MAKVTTLLFLFVSFFCSFLNAQKSKNVKVLAHWNGEEVPFNGVSKYNDTWGFVVDGEEYGCIGSTLGTHVFALPEDHLIKEVAFIPGRFQGSVVHRDFAFFENYLYAVCDQGSSSLQVIDVSNLPYSWNVVLDDTTNVKTAHNVTVDEFGEKLYVSGPSGSAMKVFSLAETPENPELINDFNDVVYVHDVYARRDSVFLNAGNQGLFIFDFTDGESPQILSSLSNYPDLGYNHSGWASENGELYAFADETLARKMKIIDITDMSDLSIVSLFNSNLSSAFPEVQTAPHNLQWVGDKIYVSHYFDGLQVFDVSDPENPTIHAYYDTYPEEDIPWRGAWGVYVMPSGRILISDRQTGLYMFKLAEESDDDSDFWVYPNPAPGEFNINLSDQTFDCLSLKLTDMEGRRVFSEEYLNPKHDMRHIKLTIPFLNAGLYVLEGKYNDTTTQKIISIY